MKQAFSLQGPYRASNPGRRYALPWAGMRQAVGLAWKWLEAGEYEPASLIAKLGLASATVKRIFPYGF